MNQKIKTIAVAYNPHLAQACALMAGLIAVSLFLYGFFLLEAVSHTASRTQAERRIGELTSRLSVLEQSYLSQTRTITLEHAGELGLVAPAGTATVYAGVPSRTLTLLTQ